MSTVVIFRQRKYLCVVCLLFMSCLIKHSTLNLLQETRVTLNFQLNKFSKVTRCCQYLMCDEPVARDKHFSQMSYDVDCQVSCTEDRQTEGIITTAAVSDQPVFDKRVMLKYIIVLYVMNQPPSTLLMPPLPGTELTPPTVSCRTYQKFPTFHDAKNSILS